MQELRQDLVTKKWVIIADERHKRPHQFKIDLTQKEKGVCVFCNPEKTGQKKDTQIFYDSKGRWQVRSFPNLFPALSKGKTLDPKREGPYSFEKAIGFHEVIVTRDHSKSIAVMDFDNVEKVIRMYRERYVDLMNRKFVKYISIFHNHGKSAGASILHPHSQLIAIPEVPLDVRDELEGAEQYYQSNRQNVYSVMLSYEEEDKERIVYQNEEIIAFCPFASRSAYEVWLMPRKPSPYFERSDKKTQAQIAKALQAILYKMRRLLNNPDYNYYLHTAPCDGNLYDHYTWHLEILPHTATWAGFELGTGIEINSVRPEVVAKELNSIELPTKKKQMGVWQKLKGFTKNSKK